LKLLPVVAMKKDRKNIESIKKKGGMNMRFFVGLDLHSRNTVIAVLGEKGNRKFCKRVPNDIDQIASYLARFPGIQGIVFESTYNWYWLADGLIEKGYSVHIATPGAIVPYKGLKHSDDFSDAYWLADMLRLGILPEGYIIPREKRLLRDLLRKRCKLVNQRTASIISVKNLFLGALCFDIDSSKVKKMTDADVDRLVTEKSLNFSIKSSLAIIRLFEKQIALLENETFRVTKNDDHFQQLQSVKGIGKILALAITLECGNIERFKGAGHFASYCRCVPSQRISNGKIKGENNRKNGNKYLAWAFVEAAVLSKKYCPYARSFYEKKKKASGKRIIAIKALANKLAKACYYIMRDGVSYDGTKIYKGQLSNNDLINKI
jgi:transposase